MLFEDLLIFLAAHLTLLITSLPTPPLTWVISSSIKYFIIFLQCSI
ncbi:hypothetical protein QWZ13_19360 [Reinekea marina]|nr:hypothetical protein [Reinekea marina]MDN3647318.1 hypothetical protein [Reinekea marina]MDN3651074.1 hypothetical protein [Reinekea marina]